MISLNIFTKCPNTGNPKTRMSMLLDKKGRSNLSQEMLLCILSEIKYMDASIRKCLWVYPDYNNPWIESLSKEYKLILNKRLVKLCPLGLYNAYLWSLNTQKKLY